VLGIEGDCLGAFLDGVVEIPGFEMENAQVELGGKIGWISLNGLPVELFSPGKILVLIKKNRLFVDFRRFSHGTSFGKHRNFYKTYLTAKTPSSPRKPLILY
jgi:hypothetical protein